MKEGKLSSALMERYGINEENAIGTVLWHSLNESGEIGVYDMKFGDTVVRNLTEADVEATIEEGHGHPPKRDDDPDRKKKSKEEKEKEREFARRMEKEYYQSGTYSGD
jgi:hypothetical protein